MRLGVRQGDSVLCGMILIGNDAGVLVPACGRNWPKSDDNLGVDICASFS